MVENFVTKSWAIASSVRFSKSAERHYRPGLAMQVKIGVGSAALFILLPTNVFFIISLKNFTFKRTCNYNINIMNNKFIKVIVTLLSLFAHSYSNCNNNENHNRLHINNIIFIINVTSQHQHCDPLPFRRHAQNNHYFIIIVASTINRSSRISSSR